MGTEVTDNFHSKLILGIYFMLSSPVGKGPGAVGNQYGYSHILFLSSFNSLLAYMDHAGSYFKDASQCLKKGTHRKNCKRLGQGVGSWTRWAEDPLRNHMVLRGKEKPYSLPVLGHVYPTLMPSA